MEDGAIWLRRKENNNVKRVLSCEEQKEICCILSSVWIQRAREEEGLFKSCLCWVLNLRNKLLGKLLYHSTSDLSIIVIA